MAADLIVLVLTWIKTFRQWREGRKLNVPFPISACLLRDGEICRPYKGVRFECGYIGTWYFMRVNARHPSMTVYPNFDDTVRSLL